VSRLDDRLSWFNLSDSSAGGMAPESWFDERSSRVSSGIEPNPAGIPPVSWLWLKFICDTPLSDAMLSGIAPDSWFADRSSSCRRGIPAVNPAGISPENKLLLAWNFWSLVADDGIGPVNWLVSM